MALTKVEREALKELRRKVTLERAGLTPPPRAFDRGYRDHQQEPFDRPLAQVKMADSNEWTNDVANSLKIYTESWILPIIDALLDESGDKGKRHWTEQHYLADLARRY